MAWAGERGTRFGARDVCRAFRAVVGVGLASAAAACASGATAETPDLLDPISVYAVNSDDHTLSLMEGDDETAVDSETWRRVRALLPPDILDDRVAEFHVFSDGADEFLAYVAQLGTDRERWLFAVDYVDAVDADAGEWVTTLTHEFAHIIGLGDSQVDPFAEQCGKQFEIDEGCARSTSWLQRWFDAFWAGERFVQHRKTVGDAEANPAALEAFYRDHEDAFVNEYAATNPVEDFAESFAYFVFMDRIVEPRTEREDKVNFFHDYRTLRSVRAHIRAQTAVRRAAIDDHPE